MQQQENNMQESTQHAVTLLKAIAHEKRLMILCALQQAEMSVSTLNKHIPIPQSTLSQQLAYLRKEGFVKVRREAQNIYYSLNSQEVIKIIAVLHELYCEKEDN